MNTAPVRIGFHARIAQFKRMVISCQLNAGKVVPRVGLTGIQERMHQFGGSLEITPSDSGTTVTAIIPLETTFRKAV